MCFSAATPRRSAARERGSTQRESDGRSRSSSACSTRNRPDPADALGTLAALGGFEIALLAGVTLGAAECRAIVVLDGFITSAAALVATRLEPAVTGYLVASHLSPEPGHALVLDDLGLDPLLDLGLRLGEGSGAALALPLLEAARAILVEMATFEEAGVTDTGR